ncbi:MAG TPA: hypothetical protein VH478_00890 [Trebonia sp.]|nr:hypothetical protein [Trebonia sp.]
MSRAAHAALAIIFLSGLWLVAAPFALRFQPPHAGWSGATRLDVAVGGALAVAGFTGLLAALAGRVREMYADADREAGSCDTSEL